MYIGVWENKNVYDEIIFEEMGFFLYVLIDYWNFSKIMIKKNKIKMVFLFYFIVLNVYICVFYSIYFVCLCCMLENVI